MSNLGSLSNSYIQQANWFLYKFNPTGLADKVSTAIRMTSSIDITTVQKTLQVLIKRHPMLRSLYYEQDGNLISQIKEDVKINWKEMSQIIISSAYSFRFF